jgi:hypothetical protein
VSARDTDAVTLGGVHMPRAAAEACEWAGVDPAEDVCRLRNGQITATALTLECLDGVDDAEIDAAWREYVDAVACAADAAEVQS